MVLIIRKQEKNGQSFIRKNYHLVHKFSIQWGPVIQPFEILKHLKIFNWINYVFFSLSAFLWELGSLC